MVISISSTRASYTQAEICHGFFPLIPWLPWSVFAVVLALTPSTLPTSLSPMVFISVPFNSSQKSQIPQVFLIIHTVNILVIILMVTDLIWPTFQDMKCFVTPSFVHSLMDHLLCMKVVSLHAWWGRFSPILLPFQGLLLRHCLVAVHDSLEIVKFMWRMNFEGWIRAHLWYIWGAHRKYKNVPFSQLSRY